MKVLMNFFLFIGLIIPAHSYLKVHSPATLNSKFAMKYADGHIPVSIGNFGNPPYGQTLTGQLVIEQGKDSKACSALPNIDEFHSISSFILMVNRGDCAFVSKVLHAQNIGAKAVIVMNDVDEDIENFIMTDNGSAGNLDIPALLISKEDGTAFRDYMPDSRYTDITLTIKFEMNKAQGQTLDIIVYMQSTSETTLTLLTKLTPYLDNFPNLKFTPHYFIFECGACRESGFKSKMNECISGGRYCAYDSDGSGKLEGKDTVVEDLRQICIHKLVDKDYKKWFYYIKLFHKDCFSTFDGKCIENILNKIGVSPGKVKKCIENSVEGIDLYLNDNKLMREEKLWYDKERIPFNPAIVINNLVYRGDLEVELVLQAFCASYFEEYKPDYCRGNRRDGSKKKDRGNVFLWAVGAGIVLVAVGILIVYRLWVGKTLKKDLKKEVNRAVSDYFQLAEIAKN